MFRNLMEEALKAHQELMGKMHAEAIHNHESIAEK